MSALAKTVALLGLAFATAFLWGVSSTMQAEGGSWLALFVLGCLSFCAGMRVVRALWPK